MFMYHRIYSAIFNSWTKKKNNTVCFSDLKNSTEIIEIQPDFRNKKIFVLYNPSYFASIIKFNKTTEAQNFMHSCFTIKNILNLY